MNIPKPPWYSYINTKLEGVEWVVDVLLILVIGISAYLLLAGDRVTKTGWLVYVVSP